MDGRKRSLAASLVSAPFVICVVVLAAAVVGRGTLARRAKGVLRKEPIELRTPLGLLDATRLAPYVREAQHNLSAAMEDALGTADYLDWVLVDRSVPGWDPSAGFSAGRDPRGVVNLSITYYTGGANLAPHTPDVCRLGGGYQPKQPHEYRTIDVPTVGEVPVRVCTFVKTAIFQHDEPTVVYTFHASGEFTASRSGVRNLTRRITNRYAYFSKVEVSFGGPGCQPPNLGREESVAAAAKLFDTVLPILLEEHWPDKANLRGRAAGEPG
jgi:hypothetical protein